LYPPALLPYSGENTENNNILSGVPALPLAAIRNYIHHESFSGLLLFAAAVLAMVMDNSALSWLYDAILNTPVTVRIGDLSLDKPLLLWINDGLMAIFFLLVGLELKRELLEGQLSSRDQMVLPGIAALGGIIVPALIYASINGGDPELARGWAIPTATDIAFALGVMALLGRHAPTSLKLFLLALAILDDLGAIIIIAVFYTENLSFGPMVAALGAIAGLAALNLFRVSRLAPYILVGIVLWVSVLKSGVHATLAGVVLAMFIPLHNRGGTGAERPLRHLEHALHPYVAYGIMPVFAFANAGISFSGMSFGTLLEPLPLAIALGLFIGKQTGVFAAVWLVVRAGLARRPEGASWMQIYGVALLTGIGFTMSLFIGMLSFADPEHATGVRLGVITGSLLSAIVGFLTLRLAPSRADT